MRTSHRFTALLTVLTAMVLGGCSTGSDPEAGTQTPAASKETWARVVDHDSGVRFRLPEATKPQTSANGGRVYQTKNDDYAVTVTLFRTPPGTGRSEFKAIYGQLRDKLAGTGATEVALSGVHPVDYHGHDGLDGTLTFAATNGDPAYWRMRTLAAGRTAVSIQVMSFATPKRADTVRTLVDDAFTRATKSLELPLDH